MGSQATQITKAREFVYADPMGVDLVHRSAHARALAGRTNSGVLLTRLGLLYTWYTCLKLALHSLDLVESDSRLLDPRRIPVTASSGLATFRVPSLSSMNIPFVPFGTIQEKARTDQEVSLFTDIDRRCRVTG